MFQFLQSNKAIRFILVALLIVLGVAMLFFGNVSSADPAFGQSEGNVAQIDGTVITQAEFHQTYQSLWALFALQSGRVPQDSAEMTQRLNLEAWRWLLMLHGSEKLGILVSNDEVAQMIASMPPFLNQGKFDENTYKQFLTVVQNRFNITEAGFEQLVREQIAISRFQQTLLAPVQVTDADVDEVFGRFFSPVTMAVAIFPIEPFLKQVKVTDEEIENYYEENKDANPELRTPEMREVSYVKFELKPSDRELDPGARARVLNAVNELAVKFYRGLLPEDGAAVDFREVAKEQGYPVQDSGSFNYDTVPQGISKQNVAPFVQAAYGLSPERPLGRAVLRDKEGKQIGMVLMTLEKVSETQALPLAKAKAVITNQLRQEKGAMAHFESVNVSMAELRSKMAGGQTFEQAAKELGLEVKTLPSFVPGNRDPQNTSPKMAQVKVMAVEMQPGDVSGVLQQAGGQGYFVASLIKRGEPDNEKFGPNRSFVRQQLLGESREAVMGEWIREQMANPKTVAPAALQPEAPSQTGLGG